MEKETKPSIVQDNALTQVRYAFSLTEKRMMYCILRKVQENYEKGGDRTIFNDFIVRVNAREIREVSDKSVSVTYEKMKMFRSRPVTIDNDKYHFEGGFINYFKHIKDTDEYEVQVSGELMPFFVELTRNFTVLDANAVMLFKSVYSQRMFEFCCQYRNRGRFFFFSIEELREMFCLGDKYKSNKDFINRVLKPAQEEIKAAFDGGFCDLYFDFVGDEKTKNGKSFTRYNFFIRTESEAERKKMQIEEYKTAEEATVEIFRIMSEFFPTDKKYVKRVVEYLHINPDSAKTMLEKVHKTTNSYSIPTIPKILRTILKVDFGVK